MCVECIRLSCLWLATLDLASLAFSQTVVISLDQQVDGEPCSSRRNEFMRKLYRSSFNSVSRAHQPSQVLRTSWRKKIRRAVWKTITLNRLKLKSYLRVNESSRVHTVFLMMLLRKSEWKTNEVGLHDCHSKNHSMSIAWQRLLWSSQDVFLLRWRGRKSLRHEGDVH